MSAFDALRYRASTLRRALFDRDAYRRELNAEFSHHMELERMQQEHDGLSGDDARREARARFGNPRRVREQLVDGTGASAVDALRQDVRFALRTLRASPGFTLIAILTLAIGIGANTAIFSAVNALLVRPLPFPAPQELMQVGTTSPGFADRPARTNGIWSYPKFVVFRDGQTVFRDLALWTEWQSVLRGAEGAERVRSEMIGATYLRTLGVRPALGRDFVSEEDRPGGARTVIVSDAFWSSHFNADPHVLGRSLNVDNVPYTIVGVLPPEFRGLSGRAELLMPIASQPALGLDEAWNHSFPLVARVKPGVPYARVEREVARLGTRVDAAYPDPGAAGVHWGADVRPLNATRVDPAVRRALLVLLGAVGLVLLIACANVANLLLVRATGRQREVAVRLALGAGRGRLVRQLLTESLVLAAAGGALSLALAWWAVRALSRIDAASALQSARLGGLGAVSFATIRLDWQTLAAAGALCLLTGVLFGLVPALQATRPSLAGALKEQTNRAGAGRRSQRGRSALAAAEIALALVLLAGSGLMLRSLAKLLDVRVGVDPSRVLAMRLGGRAGDVSRDSLPAFYDQIVERLSAIPGVTGVALSDCPPLNGGCNGTFARPRDRPEPLPGHEIDAGVHWITPSWPAVMRAPLLRGRTFTRDDRLGTRKVVLINETAARTIWPGEDPLGKPISVGQGGFHKDTAYVVGVLADVKYFSLDTPAKPDVYLSYYQSPTRMGIYVRAAGDPLALADPVRRALREIAPDAPLYDVRPLTARFGDAMAFARLSTILLALFAAVALALATLGVYGVVSYAAAQRTREMSIRVALGASRGDVAWLVLRHGVGIALAGGALGLLSAAGATRVLRSLLYGVAPSDPVTFAAIGAVLFATVLLASWTPARRAARAAPAEALRDS